MPVKDSGPPDIKDRYRRWLDVAGSRLKPDSQKMALVEIIPD